MLLRGVMGKALLTVLFFFVMASVGYTTGNGTVDRKSDQSNSAPLPQNLSEDQIESMLAVMSDDQVRRLLLDQLKESAKKEVITEYGEVSLFEQQSDLFNQRARQVLASGRNDMGKELSLAYHQLVRNKGNTELFIMLFKVVLLLGLSFLAEWLVRRRITVLDKNLLLAMTKTGQGRYGRIAYKLLQGAISLLVFFLAAFVIFQIQFVKGDPGRWLGYVIFMIVFYIRLANLVLGQIFSPRDQKSRLVTFNDESAILIFRWSMVAISLGVIVGFFSKLLILLGVSQDFGLFIRCFTGPAVALPLIFMAIHHGKVMKDRMGAETSIGTSYTAVGRVQKMLIFHTLFILYVVCGWGIGQFTMLTSGQGTMGRFLLSFAAIPLFILLDKLGQSFLNRFMLPKSTEEGSLKEEVASEKSEDETTREENMTTSRYSGLVRWILRFFLVILIMSVLIEFWGLKLPWSAAISDTLFSILITVVMALLAWEYTKNAIEKKLGAQEENKAELADEPGGSSKNRLFTLLPLLRKCVGVIILVTVILIVLSSLGVEIAPLLASAGIFGLAIGLGAQTLIKDIIAGVFFLVDDAFRVGDYVKMGSVEGTVEKISIRTVTMRHYKGQVEVLPYGDIKNVTNFSRGPMLVKFNLYLPADTDVKTVKKIVKKINEEMQDDPEFAPNLIEPIKSQGVRNIEDGVMTIRVKFRANPGTQFLIKRQAFERIQKALKKASIPFASRGVSIISTPVSTVPTPATGQNESNLDPVSGVDQTQMAAAAAAILDVPTDDKKKKE